LTPSGSGAARRAARQNTQNTRITSGEPELGLLLATVVRARATQREIREAPRRRVDDLTMARRACLQAVENYTAALASRCLPIPYQLRMELSLLRNVCGPSRDDQVRKTTGSAKSVPTDN
jgi:hypothetical protein